MNLFTRKPMHVNENIHVKRKKLYRLYSSTSLTKARGQQYQAELRQKRDNISTNKITCLEKNNSPLTSSKNRTPVRSMTQVRCRSPREPVQRYRKTPYTKIESYLLIQ